MERGTMESIGGAIAPGSDRAQPGRILYLDLARGLAVLFMVLQHVQIVYGRGGGEETLIGVASLLLGTAPAAPVFMLIMGLFFANSRRAGLRTGVVRGVRLFLFGYLLNVLRFTLPGLVTGGRGGIYEEWGTPWELFLSVDIFHLAGLSLIGLGVVKRFLPWRWARMALAVAILVASPFLWGAGGDSILLSSLWGVWENVYFPLFPWFVYPVCGMILADFLPGKIGDTGGTGDGARVRLLRRWGWALLGVGLLSLLLPDRGVFVIGDYFRSGAGVHVAILGFVLLWLLLCRRIARQAPTAAPLRLAYSWSRWVTEIYTAQWVIIGWGALVIGYATLPEQVAFVVGLVILAMSHGLAIGYGAVRGRLRRTTV